MQQWSRPRISICLAAISGVTAAIISTSAVSRPPPPPPGPTAEVSLVRQDQSDCTNANVSGSDPSLIGGTAWVVRQPDGNTSVKVGIVAAPNTKYQFFLKCVKILGNITTEDEGSGEGTFTFPTNSVGSVYGFDMYPDGAPPGNKYQSVQVKFQ
jgi:hypothetical protein